MNKPLSLPLIILIAIFAVLAAFYFGAVVTQDRPLIAACATNVKQLTIGMIMYAADHDDRLPLADNWMDASVAAYSKNYKITPYCSFIKNRKPDQIGYAMYFKLAGRKVGALADPAGSVLVFESVVLDKNAATGLVGFGDRHEAVPIGFADGHLERFTKAKPAELSKVIKANLAIK